MNRRATGACRDCGAPVQWVLVIPTRLVAGTRRKHIPLDPVYDPELGPPSHAVNLGRTLAHPITRDAPLEHHEDPALIHFATCPARHQETFDGTPTDRDDDEAEGVRPRSA